MYREFYGLLRSPFEMTPDPAFLHLGETHREGLATLVYGVRSRKGFVLLTGEVGTGKTTLLHSLLAQLDENTASAYIFNPTLEPLDFFRVLFDELDVKTPCRSKAEYLLALNHYLIDRLQKNQSALLIIDEAQNLASETLEEIRLFSNVETSTSKLIQILLFGQPELDDKLDSHALRQLRQRISVRWSLGAMSSAETGEYVRHRLSIAAGYESRFFSDAALREVHRRTRGVPRLVNMLCDRSLLAGYAAGARQVSVDIVRGVAKEMSGSPQRWRDIPRWVPAVAVLSILWVLLVGAFAWVQWGPSDPSQHVESDSWGQRDIAAPHPRVVDPLPPVASSPPVEPAEAAVYFDETVSFDAAEPFEEPLLFIVEPADPAVAISAADAGEPG